MAEIHVEPRKKPAGSGSMWIWILIALIIIAVVAYMVFYQKGNTNTEGQQPAAPTSLFGKPVPPFNSGFHLKNAMIWTT